MKNIHLILIIAWMMGCSGLISRKSTNHSLKEISIPTAQCGMCAARIDKALTGVDGILKFRVELEDLRVKVKYNNEKITLQEIEQLISKVGYQANNLPANPEAYKKLELCCKLPKDRK